MSDDDAPPGRNDHATLRLKNRIENGWTTENDEDEEAMNTNETPTPLERELADMRSAFDKQVSVTLGQMQTIRELRAELAAKEGGK